MMRCWRAARLFDYNQYASDIRAMSGEIVGCETRDPHADRRLLEFAFAVREPTYRRNGVSRSRTPGFGRPAAARNYRRATARRQHAT